MARPIDPKILDNARWEFEQIIEPLQISVLTSNRWNYISTGTRGPGWYKAKLYEQTIIGALLREYAINLRAYRTLGDMLAKIGTKSNGK